MDIVYKIDLFILAEVIRYVRKLHLQPCNAPVKGRNPLVPPPSKEGVVCINRGSLLGKYRKQKVMIRWYFRAPVTCRTWCHCGGYRKLSYRMLLFISSATGCMRTVLFDAQAFAGAARRMGLVVVDMDNPREANTCATPNTG